MNKQTPRRLTHARHPSAKFDYSLDYQRLDLRRMPELYKVGEGEQGVLLVEPYKSEILPFWRFKTPAIAKKSAEELFSLFERYKKQNDFIGMDMTRKYIQMGYTRARRYANHKSGTKYDADNNVKPLEVDTEKARSAEIFKIMWMRVEEDPTYADLKIIWKMEYG